MPAYGRCGGRGATPRPGHSPYLPLKTGFPNGTGLCARRDAIRDPG